MSSHRKTWKGQSQSPRAQTKQCPIAGMTILKNDGTNVVEWTEQAQLYLTTTFGKAARKFRDGVREERVVPTPQTIAQKYPDSKGFTKDAREKLLIAEVTKFDKENDELEDAHVKIWGTLMQVMEEAGRERVATHPKFKIAKDRWDVLMLWNIIIHSHSVGTNAYSNEEKADKAFEDYMRYSQGRRPDSQSLSNYMNNWQAKLDNLRASKCSYQPSEQESARRFLKKLDPTRYLEYMLKVVNDARRDPDAWPKTFQEVVDGARSHIPSGRPLVVQQEAHALAYGAQVREEERTFDGECHRCHQHGHMARNCPNRASASGARNAHIAAAQSNVQPTAASNQPPSTSYAVYSQLLINNSAVYPLGP